MANVAVCFDQYTHYLPQPCQHEVSKPPRVYCLGSHTDDKISWSPHNN